MPPVASLSLKKAQEYVLEEILAMRLPGLIWILLVDSRSTFQMVLVNLSDGNSGFRKLIGGGETTEDWETHVWRHSGQSAAPL